MKKNNNKDEKLSKKSPAKTNEKTYNAGDGTGFPIVGIGASAGGLETLEKFFGRMPEGSSGMAFVVIQHLSPTHKSIMAAILERYTSMPVKEITGGTRIEKNHVYLNPPGRYVVIHGMELILSEISGEPVKMPVDHFLRSLAGESGDKAICIILSGTASDGTLGIKAVKERGGMVMIQDPETAKYDGMPRSAAATGLADFILPVEQMPEVLFKYIKHPFADITYKAAERENNWFEIHPIFRLIKAATGNDFSHYKQSTIKRRIERRLALHKINKLSDYVQYLQRYPDEVIALFHELVINVTSFFRDPEAFEALKREALQGLIRTKTPDAGLRVWVAGCSTGEEVYSLAILITEVMEIFKININVQIFATDIDKNSLETARKGIYPKSIEQDVSEERLSRFFINDRGFYRVKKQIREMVVFSVHNVVHDPPFSKLDLLSCRNLMIYMDDILQKKILSLFQYSLNSEGILFLGTSESIGDFGLFFRTLNAAMKIFQYKGGRIEEKEYDYKREGYMHNKKTEKDQGGDISGISPDIRFRAEKLLLYEYGPSGALINDSHEIIHFIGDTDKYLAPPKGRASFNILNMARDGLRERLAPAVYRAVKEKKEVSAKEVLVKHTGGNFTADITVKPMDEPGLSQEFLLVIFDDKSHPKKKTVKKESTVKSSKSPEAEKLKKELKEVREYLQANIAQLETANEELKSANEELQSVNEELQSTNEELETSKEELQSTNEELVTVNSELQDKVAQLIRVNDDMNNLLNATEIASIFLDMDLRIMWFTPAAANIVNLIQTDIGRPLDDLRTNISDVDITMLAREVLKNLNTIEKVILSGDNIWYSLRVTPYRTVENLIDGAVMTFVNIQKIKQAESITRFGAVLRDSADAIMVLDLEGNIRAWNKGATLMYGWSESEALSMNIYRVVPEERKDETRGFLEALKSGKGVKAFKTDRIAKDGSLLKVWTVFTLLAGQNGKPEEIAATERNLAWLAGQE